MDSLGQIAIVAAEQGVVAPLLAVHLAVAEGVTEGHQHLAVDGIAVVPGNPEVGAGDAETLQRFVSRPAW